MKMKLIVMFFLSFSFYGCTSNPSFSEHYAELPKLKPEEARVYIYRPGTLGAVVRPELELNGQQLGTVRANSFVYFDIAPGDYELLAKTGKENVLNFVIDKGEKKYIRLNTRMSVFGSQIIPILMDYSQALEEIDSTYFKSR